MTGMDGRGGEWTGHYPLFMVVFVIILGNCGAITPYAHSVSGSWAAYLITPLVGAAFVSFALINSRRFDGPARVRRIQDAADSGDEGRCAWCNGPCTGGYCSDKCEAEFRAYERRLGRNAGLYTAGPMIPILLFMAFLSAGNFQLGLGLMFMGHGALLINLPLTLPGTVHRFGTRGSLTVTRLAGVAMLAIGAFITIGAPPM